MQQEEIWRELGLLPPEAQREVADFISFLRRRYKAPCREKAGKKKLMEEPFVGMWSNRKDLKDSGAWVRNIREREWESHE